MSTFKNIGETEQKAWEAVRNQKTFTLRSIHETSGVGLKNLPQIIGRMVSAELVEVDRSTKPHIYKLKKDVGHHCPSLDIRGQKKQPSSQDRIWLAIKPLKTFNARDVSLYAETVLSATKVYLHLLAKAGYITIISQSGGKNIYMFNRKMDTGLRSPSIIGESVYDRNLQKTVWIKPVPTGNNGGVE